MSGGTTTKGKNKKQPENPSKMTKQTLSVEATGELAREASLDSISLQIRTLTAEIKTELQANKEEITTEMRKELSEFKRDINKLLDNMDKEIKEQTERIQDGETRTEELEQWSYDANKAIQHMLQQQKYMEDKLEDFEARARRNNLRVYGIKESKEAKPSELKDMIEGWLKKELGLEDDLQIQRVNRAQAPKPREGQTPRSIIIQFQQSKTKDMILYKAWEKKKMTFEGEGVYFDHDYTAKVLQQRKAYLPIKKKLKSMKIRFQTPYTKMRIFWEDGMKIYNNAEEAARDLKTRGCEVEGFQMAEEGIHKDKETNVKGLASWKQVGDIGTMKDRVRERLQEYELRRKKTDGGEETRGSIAQEK
uniref:L1 transposable element RRM domain-containing protein n=1 Tax=Nothobranchius korthausae TaxID=1143690 RepID=A0A1A8EYN8_9TELE